MHKIIISTWIIITLLICPAAFAQSNLQAASKGGESLMEVCKDDPRAGTALAVCDEYIATFHRDHADILIGISQAIDAQKDKIKPLMAKSIYWDHFVQGTLIILAFLTTIATAIARIYRDRPLGKRYEVGVWPIVLAACVSGLTSFNAYYKFDDIRDQHKAAIDQLVQLQSDFNFELVSSARAQGNEKLNLAKAKAWKEKLDGVLAGYTGDEKSTDKKSQASN